MDFHDTSNETRKKMPAYRIDLENLGAIVDVLKRKDFVVLGPQVQDGAIVYDEISSISDLPVGWTDEQSPAAYRLSKRTDRALFGFAVGPHSWKKFLFPPVAKLFDVKKKNGAFELTHDESNPTKYAFIGVRPCEIHAIVIQDRVFLGGDYHDETYAERRSKLFILAVNCASPSDNCFCTSLHTGPKVSVGFDLVLTEVLKADAHYFIAEVGSEQGEEVLKDIKFRAATVEEIQDADAVILSAAQKMKKQVHTEGLKDTLYNSINNARWDVIGKRCLTCANCTMVCPTCFCFSVEDVADLTDSTAERWRKWDSCFTADFSYIHGGSIRSSPKSRYRQWMTHKFASWLDQFGTFGCVGCGRCITWCPVGIDITEEIRALSDQHTVQTIP